MSSISSDVPRGRTAGGACVAPLRQTLPRLVRDPIAMLEEVSRRAGGAVVRVDLGLFRPYLITHPDHLQHVFVDNAGNYVREGMLWRPVRRLIGHGLGGEGARWWPSRQLIQPLFSAKNVATLLDPTTSAIAEAVDELDPAARAGQPVDAAAAMTNIVNRATVRVFFGDRISAAHADRLTKAIDAGFTSLSARMLLPFVPETVPLPGDRRFRDAARTVDEIVRPLVRRSQADVATTGGVVALLCQAQDADGGLDNRQVIDDIKAMFVAASETSAVSLSWLWVALARNPEVAARVRQEVDAVVGTQTPQPAHLPQLSYTRMVLSELIRLYPAAWMIPRRVLRDDVVGGVRLKAGSSVVVSPYLTHRLEWLWERAEVFDPERFAPGSAKQRHRYAYLPFGGGAHQCLGTHFFMAEALLTIATVLSRYDVSVHGSAATLRPLPAVTLRPSRKIELFLTPRR